MKLLDPVLKDEQMLHITTFVWPFPLGLFSEYPAVSRLASFIPHATVW